MKAFWKALKRFLFLTFIVFAGLIASIVLLVQIPDVSQKINGGIFLTVLFGLPVMLILVAIVWIARALGLVWRAGAPK